MKTKTETRPSIFKFITFVKNQFDAKIKIIRSDNGMEFNMPDYYAFLGVLHQTSCVETPQQNSIVERKHRHLVNVTRALLFQSHLAKSFWSFAVSHSVHIINRLPSLVLKHKTPFELLHNTPQHTLI